MEVAKLSIPLNLEVRLVSCNESAIKRWLSSELEETVFSLIHELFMTKHHTVTLRALIIVDEHVMSLYEVIGAWLGYLRPASPDQFSLYYFSI